MNTRSAISDRSRWPTVKCSRSARRRSGCAVMSRSAVGSTCRQSSDRGQPTRCPGSGRGRFEPATSCRSGRRQRRSPMLIQAPTPHCRPRPSFCTRCAGRETTGSPTSAALAATVWTVSSRSDRVGTPAWKVSHCSVTPRRSGMELPSEGVVRGAIQVPPGGEPVIFMADHPVTGGYPVVAVLVDDDTDRAAQAVPGQQIRIVSLLEDGQCRCEIAKLGCHHVKFAGVAC